MWVLPLKNQPRVKIRSPPTSWLTHFSPNLGLSTVWLTKKPSRPFTPAAAPLLLVQYQRGLVLVAKVIWILYVVLPPEATHHSAAAALLPAADQGIVLVPAVQEEIPQFHSGGDEGIGAPAAGH